MTFPARLVAAAMLVATPHVVCAQGPARAAVVPSSIGDPAVDSATVARAAWSRAIAAQRAGDAVVASREAARAAAAWPTQPAYLWGSATTAARAGDSTAAMRALAAYADLGLGRDLRAEPAFTALATRPDFVALIRQHDTNRAPFVRSVVRAVLPDTTLWPEGFDYDARTRSYYVSSVRHRTIAELSADGSVRELWPRDRPDMGAILGVRVDTARRVLWATTSTVPQMARYDSSSPPVAALLRIRLPDGAIERRWTLPPSPRGHVLGDLAVDTRGDVWITDSNDPVVYRLRAGSDTLERTTSPLFRSLQGIAPTTDGRAVYIADYSHGLLRLDPDTRVVTRLIDAPSSTSLGCDGLVWYHGSLIGVQNGVVPARIMRFALDATGTRILTAERLDQNTTVADEPTLGAIIGDSFVYVATSQWEKHDAAGERLPGVALAPVVLLAALMRF